MRTFVVLATLTACLAVVGCAGGVKEEDIKVDAANDPLNEPRSVLKRYSEGQALGSEVAAFPNLVANVRKVDKDRADILEKGLSDIQKAPKGEVASKAKELLQKLQPSMKASQ